MRIKPGLFSGIVYIRYHFALACFTVFHTLVDHKHFLGLVLFVYEYYGRKCHRQGMGFYKEKQMMQVSRRLYLMIKSAGLILLGPKLLCVPQNVFSFFHKQTLLIIQAGHNGHPVRNYLLPSSLEAKYDQVTNIWQIKIWAK